VLRDNPGRRLEDPGVVSHIVTLVREEIRRMYFGLKKRAHSHKKRGRSYKKRARSYKKRARSHKK